MITNGLEGVPFFKKKFKKACQSTQVMGFKFGFKFGYKFGSKLNLNWKVSLKCFLKKCLGSP